jgi:archaeal flagellin FlaB
MFNIFTKDKNGFNGLEIAIIAITFLIIPAALSYVILGENFGTTFTGKEVAHASIDQASCSLALSGDINIEGRNNVIDASVFYIKRNAGETLLDLNKTIVTYTDKDDFETRDYASGAWSYTPVNKKIGATNLVEEDDIYRIVVHFTSFNLTSLPGANEVITLEMKSPAGASLIIKRTMPSSITSDPVNPTFYMAH